MRQLAARNSNPPKSGPSLPGHALASLPELSKVRFSYSAETATNEQRAADPRSTARKVRDPLLRSIGAGLDWLAADPDRQRGVVNLFGRIGLDLIPWVGPVKKLLDARRLIQTGDERLQHEGRVLALLGLAELTLDTATLGGSALLPDELLTSLRTVRDFLRPGGLQRPAAKLFPDPISLALAPIARAQPIRRALDGLFTTV